jgi:hypothetical protein
MKKIVSMPFGFWLLTIAAVGALVTPERSTFVTVLLVVILVCGVGSAILGQRQANAERERLKARR